MGGALVTVFCRCSSCTVVEFRLLICSEIPVKQCINHQCDLALLTVHDDAFWEVGLAGAREDANWISCVGGVLTRR